MNAGKIRVAPLKVCSMEEMWENWPVAWNEASGRAISTDNVRASELMFDYDFPENAESDAQVIANKLGEGYEARSVREGDRPFLSLGSGDADDWGVFGPEIPLDQVVEILIEK